MLIAVTLTWSAPTLHVSLRVAPRTLTAQETGPSLPDVASSPIPAYHPEEEEEEEALLDPFNYYPISTFIVLLLGQSNKYHALPGLFSALSEVRLFFKG